MKIYKYNGPDNRIRLYLRQLLTALGPLMGVAVSGMSNGYSAILLPQLKTVPSNDSESSAGFVDAGHFGSLTIDQESWIAAASVLPMAPGCWTGGIMAERLGRKMSVLLLFPVFSVSWLIIGFANSVNSLVAGRLLIGYCVGILAPIVPIYVGETSDPLLRGILLGAISVFLSVGILTCHAMGTWLHWRTTAYICGTLPVLCFVICIFSRESPMWLLGRGKGEQARRSWVFFRGEQSLEEFHVLETTRTVEISKQNAKKRSMLRTFRKIWSSRYFLRPFAIVSLYFFITQFSGSNVMSFYCVEMLADITGPTYAYLITLVLSMIRLIFGILACILLKTCNRRIMTFLSGFGTAATLLCLSMVLTFNIGKPWIPIVLFIVYTALLPLGLVPIPWLLCGELFARKYRGLGSGLTSGFGFICFFVVIKTMPSMIELMKSEGTFAVYSIVALIGTSILYFILPETKNKTLQEIQATFDKEPQTPKVQGITQEMTSLRSVKASIVCDTVKDKTSYVSGLA